MIFLSFAICSILLPSLYAVDYPLVPPLDRTALTTLVLAVLLYIRGQKNPIFKPGVWNKFLVSYLLIIIISTLLNYDDIEPGGVFIQGSTPYDALSNIALFFLQFMPFIFGRNFLDNLEDTEYMFKALVMLGLIYTVPMVWELRFSPQLHLKTFGYFPGDFIQQVRGDGFRPVVFIGHGLALAFWFSICGIALLALHKAKAKSIKFLGLIIVYFTVILVLCKTVSALIYFGFAAVLIYFLKPKKQLKISIIIAFLVMLYPFNTAFQFIKNSDVLDYVATKSVEREQSLETRFTNEAQLMERALEKPIFGWAGWGRNRVYLWGRDVSITDGRWIMELGVYGIAGFIFYYLILIYPIILASKCYKYIDNKKHQVYFAALALILAIGIFDSIPNTGMLAIHLVLAGALMGQAERLRSKQKQLRLEKLQV